MTRIVFQEQVPSKFLSNQVNPASIVANDLAPDRKDFYLDLDSAKLHNNLIAMETTSKGMRWTGLIIMILVVLFLLVDAIMKVLETTPSVEGSVQLGWPSEGVQGIGIVLLIATVLYVIPRTAILGAILITGYLGGATAIMIRANVPGHPYLFPVFMGVLVWAGLYLRDAALRALIPLRKL